ncbi:TetR/AcrR family transcriptional regulator [uncultured Dokdonia sp.]|jgi:AcrR family transcriptional regulator|uniref:TetR/AcrR family transcriptional regulator n=1 Tax=unclassified Dokdonia TaxID=2615033 RepID=UPI00260A4728|nr:TetR/AcrR family transcriptional regulator [uncultured Dokdonia sp.]|tara:strand:+ start:314046 stop:314651 length:606 start_codon:yes stop_codon:yes gene_type:complete
MKDQLLHTATELFLSQGFKSITMDDIAKEMGMSKKTVYSYYSNKEAIVSASAMQMFTDVCGGIDTIFERELNPIEELYDIKKYVLEHINGERTSSMYQLQKYYPKIHQTLRKSQYDYMQSCVTRNVLKGIEQELFISDISVEFVVNIYFTGMTGIKDETIFPKSTFPVSDLYDMYLEYHIRGIVTPKGRKILNKLIKSNHN